jgi:Clp amino terminal domain, pathogenicity island component/Glyoxalase superfamily protein
MRTFRDAKAMAQSLRTALVAMGFKISVSQSLELIAKAFGVGDWNRLAAAIRPQVNPVPESSVPPGPAPPAENPKKAGMLSGPLELMLNKAFAYARERKHGVLTVEHLLLFLLDDADAAAVMRSCGVDRDVLRKKLASYIDTELQSHAILDGDDTPKPTLGFQRVLQRAVFHVHQAGKHSVTTNNVLVAVFSEKHSRAVQLLNEQSMNRLDAVNYIESGLTRGGGGANSPS